MILTDKTTMEATPIPLAIVGIGCLFPKAAGLGYYWANIKNGVDTIRDVPPTHWDPADYYDPDPKAPDRTYARRGGFLDPIPFSPLEFGIAPRDLEATDTTQLLALVAAREALADAGIVVGTDAAAGTNTSTSAAPPTTRRPATAPDSGAAAPTNGRVVPRERIAVILGVTGTLELVIPLGARLGHPRWRKAMREAGIPEEQIDDAAARIADSYVPWQENSFPGLLGNVVAGRVANRLNLGGTNCVVDAACASSLAAVHLAALELQTGRADVVLTGGCDTFNDIFMYMCFSKTPALSPSGDARPFDARGDGTILGEGLGLVILKRLTDAERDGDTIYAVLRGIGTSSDGKGPAIYAPSAEGQRRCLRNAYRLAGVTPDTIELVEAHGTGTKVGDATEATALTQVFQELARPPLPHRPWCAIGSVKSQIGHTKAAAGAASLIKAALALYYKVLPPTIKVTQPVEPLRDPQSPFYVNTAARPWLPRRQHPRRAALSAFGFGGSNFHAVLEEHSPRKPHPDWDGRVEIVPLAASSLEEFAAAVRQLPAEWDELQRYAAAARSQFRPDSPHRLVLVVTREQSGRDQLPPTIRRSLEELQRSPAAATYRQLAPGVHYGSGPAPGRLAVLFPGQGSQYLDMLREWSCLFPEMVDTLAAANEVWEAEYADGMRLSDYIYPPPRFDDERRRLDERALQATTHAQPALGAISWGMWRVLHERFGLSADAFAGHSYGELVALAAAGCYDLHTLIRLSCARGRLMASASSDQSGGMLAVKASAAQVTAILTPAALPLVIANHNAPQQVVLSGPVAAIEQAAKLLRQHNIGSVRLAVSAAFHSPLVAGAVEPFRQILEQADLRPPQKPVYAVSQAATYSADAAAVQAILAEQLAQPVRFVETIGQMLRDGVQTFVEVGPGSVLSRLVTAIVTEAGHHVDTSARRVRAIAADVSGGRGSGIRDLAELLAQLAASGYTVDLTAWERESRCRPPARPASGKSNLVIPICGANYVSPRPARPPRLTCSPSPSQPDAAPAAAATATSTSPTVAPKQSYNTQRPMPDRDTPTAIPLKQTVIQPDSPTAIAQTEIVPMSQGQTGSDPKPQWAELQPAASPAAGSAVPPALPADVLVQALGLNQQSFAILQRIHDQTAALHKQFLDTQLLAQQTLHTLIETQRQLLCGGAATGLAGLLPPRAAMTAPPASPVTIPPAPPAAVPQPQVLAPQAVVNVSPPTPPVPPQLQPVTPQAVAIAPPPIPAVSPDNASAPPSAPTPSPVTPIPAAPPPTPTRLAAPAAAATPAPPPASPSARTSPAAAAADIAHVLLAVVSEKTGYPVESLDLNLTLDADLGIDSIKRVEIFSTLQERLPHAPAVKSEHLGSLQTLRDIVEFLRNAHGDAAPASTSAPDAAAATPAPIPTAATTAATQASTALIPTANGPATSAPAAADITPILLAVVAEKTGYPVESLELDLALDADLGIDSIKRVEIFSTLQERLPHAPAVKSEHLGGLQTLRDIVNFLTNSRGEAAVAAAAVASESAALIPKTVVRASVVETAANDAAAGVVTNGSTTHVSIPSSVAAAAPPPEVAPLHRYVLRLQELPVGRERPPLRREPGSEGGRVWIVGDSDDVLLPPLRAELARRGLDPQWHPWAAPDAAAAGTDALAGVVLTAPPDGREIHQEALQWLQAAAPRLSRGGQSFCIAISRFGGTFGLNRWDDAASPTAAGLAGMVKTAAWEWAGTACKVIDVAASAASAGAAALAAAIADEITTYGPLEVGIVEPQSRYGLVLTPQAAGGAGSGVPFGPDDVIVVSGGGRGVTAAAALALAAVSRSTLVLMGRTPPPPETEPAWLAPLHDPAAIKRALHEHGGCPTPRQLEEEFQRIVAQRDIRNTLEGIRQRGGRGYYYPVDITDAAAVTQTIADVRRRHGPITVLVHGAGVLADRRIEDLSVESLQRVYRTKVDGLRHLLHAIDAADPAGTASLKALVVFSSTTARFGRRGQLAYACANEVLNKMAQQEARRRPGTRVVAINWGPWEGGMVTPSLQRIFAAEGIGLIPLAAGAAFLVDELRNGSREVEIAVSATPLAVEADRQAPASERTTSADVPPAAMSADVCRDATPQPSQTATGSWRRAWERRLDLTSHPVLADHVLNGRAVLPLALHVEWLVHAALHAHPGLLFHGFENLRILRGVQLPADAAIDLQAWTAATSRQEGGWVVPVELRSRAASLSEQRPERNGAAETHSRAEVLVVERLPEPPPYDLPRQLQSWPWSIEETYQQHLFHGPQWRGLAGIDGIGDAAIVGTARTAPPPAKWFTAPLRSHWVGDPLVLDCALQLMILWSRWKHRLGCLPSFVQRYRQYRRTFPAGPVRLVVRVQPPQGALLRADVDVCDSSGLIARIQGVECVMDALLERAFERNQLLTGVPGRE